MFSFHKTFVYTLALGALALGGVSQSQARGALTELRSTPHATGPRSFF